MKKSAHFLVISALTLHSCSKADLPAGTPDCLNSSIKKFRKEAGCDDRNVEAWQFHNKTVYLFNPGNCGADMTTMVMDERCNILGYLGGFAGNGHIEGGDFSTAVFIKTIWKP